MRIAFLGDFHLGIRTFRETARVQAAAAFEKALSADVIVLTGDLFHTALPRFEEVSFLVGLLQKAKGKKVLAIRGNHDAMPGDRADVYTLLQDLGLLKYLRGEGEMVGKIFIFGMGWVPDDFFLKILEQKLPRPKGEAFLVFHQSIQEEVHEGPSKNDLPGGFHLIDGHIHSKGYRHGIYFPGSTVPTTYNEDWRKGLLFWEEGKFWFEEIPSLPVFLVKGNAREVQREVERLRAEYPNARIKVVVEDLLPVAGLEGLEVEWRPGQRPAPLKEREILEKILEDFPFGDPLDFVKKVAEEGEDFLEEVEAKFVGEEPSERKGG